MKHLVTLSIIVLLISSSACKKKKVCFEEFTFRVTTVDAPSLAQKTDTIPINIHYKLYTGCQQLNSISHSISGSEIDFVLKGQEDGCECTQQITEKSTEYFISLPTSGTYYLRFVHETGFFLIDTLIVS